MKRRVFKLATASLGGAALLGLIAAGPAHAASPRIQVTLNGSQAFVTAPDGNNNKFSIENGVVKSTTPLNVTSGAGGCLNLGFVAAEGKYEADCYHPLSTNGRASFWTINGGNWKDDITLNGFRDGDTVYVDGGPGADTINAPQAVQHIDCGELRSDRSKDDGAVDHVTASQADIFTHCTPHFDQLSLK